MPCLRHSYFTIVFAALLACACSLRKPYPPKQPVVEDVSLEGTKAANQNAILGGLATIPSAKFIGIWDGVAFEYSVYDPDVLAKDLARVERYLQKRGYYEAKVVAARVIQTDARHVRVEIRVQEGAPVRTQSIRLTGLETVEIEASAAALRASPLQTNDVFDEDEYEQSKDRILRALRDRGYAFAEVTGKVRLDIATHSADVEFHVNPGPKSVYGQIDIDGLTELPREPILEALQLESGQQFSQSALEDARRALVSLGVFANVSIIAKRDPNQPAVVPIRVEVEESKLRTVRVGGGAVLDALQLETHLTAGWEHRNFLGGLRRFNIEAKPGLVYFPTRIDDIRSPNRVLFQQQIKLGLRQPSFLEGRTTGTLSAAFNVVPLLYAEPKPDEPIIGFAELTSSAGLERAFWRDHLVLAPSFNWQLELPIDYSSLAFGKDVPAEENLLDNLVITFPELVVLLDFRDDKLNTRSGALFSNSLQLASGALGSDVNDLRVKPEARFYVPISESVTFATRVTLGFLFAQDYAQTLQNPENYSDRERAQDTLKLLFRGFFSGGSNSNRGYPLRSVGPHGEIAFLTGGADCNLRQNADICAERPLGGLSLWETSFEVRLNVFGDFGVVTFLDASDVDRRRQLNLAAPHLSPGLGLRYATPIGPVRLDVGYRVPGAQDFSQRDDEGDPGEIFGAPISVHLSLGEAF